MSNEVTIPQLPNIVSPPLTSLIELSNADVSQHTSLGNVFSQITGDALISINGVITISNGIVNNAKIATNAVTTPKILDNNVTLAKLATGTVGNLISYAPSGQPVAVATGTAGQVLTSNGVGLAPTFQTVSGTGGITSINNSTAASQTFDTGTGVTLADAGATHTFSIDTATVATLTGTQTLTNKTFSTGTVFSAAPTINDGIRFEFSPNATNAGINVGSFGGEPSSPNNGDLVYDSSANQLKAYIASNWVALGSGSGPAPTSLNDLTDVTIASPLNTNILIYDSSDSMWKNQSVSGDATISNTGALTVSDNAISLAKLATGTAGNLISYAPSGQPVAVATGTPGQILTSRGAGLAPTFQSLTVEGGTGITVTTSNITYTVNIDSTVATLSGTQTLTNKTLTTPTIGDFTNATHDHSNNTNGGNLTNSALTSGIFSSITGIGEQTQALNMNTHAIQGVTFLQSNTTNTALSGVIRLARSDTIVWRNVDNDGNLPLTVNGTDNLVFESDPVVLAAATQTLTNKTFSTGTTFSAAPTINDGTKFTFSPNGTNPGLNVGSHTADPSTSEDGDVYYNSTDNELKIRVNNEWETVNTSQMTVNFSNGTYSHPNGTAENTVLTVTTNQDRTTVSYDMSTLTQNTVIRVKEEVDGTTEEIISEKTWPTDFAANTQAAEIELIGKNRDQTITFQSTTAEGAIRAIPFARRDDVVE